MHRRRYISYDANRQASREAVSAQHVREMSGLKPPVTRRRKAHVVRGLTRVFKWRPVIGINRESSALMGMTRSSPEACRADRLSIARIMLTPG